MTNQLKHHRDKSYILLGIKTKRKEKQNENENKKTRLNKCLKKLQAEVINEKLLSRET